MDQYNIVDVGGGCGGERERVELGRKLMYEPHTANTESE